MGRESEKKYADKTKKQLIEELEALYERAMEPEKTENVSSQMAEVLREEEEKWHSLVENAPNIIMIVNRDDTIQFINRTVSGFSVEEMIGKKFYDYIEPEYHDVARKAISQVFQTGETGAYEIRGLGPQDRNSWHETQVGPIRHNEQVVAVTLIATDITKRKMAEEALRESEELSRGMLETAATGIYLLQDRRFRYVNRLFEKISGYTSDELIGTYSLEYVHPDDRETVKATAIEVLKGQSSLPYEFRFIRKNSEAIWVLDWVSSIQYQGKRSLLGALVDITERKRAEAEVLDYTRQIETLFNIGATVSQTLNLTELLESILERVLRVMEIEAGGIFLLDKQTNELVLKAHRGLSEEFAQDMERIRVGEGFAGRVSLSKKPVIVDNVSTGPSLTSRVLKREGFQSLATIPIMAKERLLGVMNVGSRMHHEFSDREVQLLSTIANQLGMAIENAQLYEQALELAFTDSLTGLYNRRYLMEQIEREFTRAQRSKAALSVIMIDLDELKAINDRFGHHEGDAFLEELGRIIKVNTRASDVAARWGGDEFMILTPETSSKWARKIGERIRSQVELYRPKIDSTEVRMSISVGIASYPAHASEVTELLQRVDEAMYSAKRGGKNQLCVFSS